MINLTERQKLETRLGIAKGGLAVAQVKGDEQAIRVYTDEISELVAGLALLTAGHSEKS